MLDLPGPPHALPGVETLQRLRCDSRQGLSAEEVNARRAAFGRSIFETAAPEPGWRKFLHQFEGPVIWILLVAAALAGFMGEWSDAVVILAIVLLNGAVGYFQEEKATRALEALRGLSPAMAKAVRSGVRQFLPASELVPGDLVEVEPGDKVPADARLLECFAAQVLEATLTGESTPVEKDADAILPESTILAERRNMIHCG